MMSFPLVSVFACVFSTLVVLVAGFSPDEALSGSASSFSPELNPYFSGVQYMESNNQLLYSKVLGLRNVENNIPMTFDTQFPIGSNTKLFTAVAIYQLQEKGKLNVNDLVTSYLDQVDLQAFGYANASSKWCPVLYGDTSGTCQQITIKHLLSMSSGIIDALNCDYPMDSPYRQWCVNGSTFFYYTGSINDVIKTFINTPLTFAPGTNFSYSNPNFIIAAFIIEKLSNMTYGDYIKQHILDVVGLPNTYFDPFDGQFMLRPNLTGEYNYYWDPKNTSLPYARGSCSVELAAGSIVGTGGIVSTVGDLVKWYRALFNTKPSLVLTDESIFQILRPWTAVNKTLKSYFGQGIVVQYQDPQQAFPNLILYQGGTICSHTAIILTLNAASSTTLAPTPTSAPTTAPSSTPSSAPTGPSPSPSESVVTPLPTQIVSVTNAPTGDVSPSPTIVSTPSSAPTILPTRAAYVGDYSIVVAFRNSVNYFISPEDWKNAQSVKRGDYFKVTSTWSYEKDALLIAMQLAGEVANRTAALATTSPPTVMPTATTLPTVATSSPSDVPTGATSLPSDLPTIAPTVVTPIVPTDIPTAATSLPSDTPTTAPTVLPTDVPTTSLPSDIPTTVAP